jgi:hypothetical protein
MTLAEVLSDEAMGLAGVESSVTPGGGTTWSRGGRPFAALSADGSTAEFGLDPGVAAAAIRTPDVAASGRGSGWVAFRPAELDDHAVDRAVAWLASAHRRAGPRD